MIRPFEYDPDWWEITYGPRTLRDPDAFRRLQRKCGVPSRFFAATLENFERVEGTEDAMAAATRFMGDCEEYGLLRIDPDDPPIRGLLFAGGVGTGKSHLALALANLHLREGYCCVALTASDFLECWRRSYTAGDDAPGLEKLLVDCDLLIFDDLGAEKLAGGEKGDWARERLFRVIDARYCDERPVIVTTNAGPDDLERRVGARITSRLAQTCEVALLTCDDYRRRRLADRTATT